MPLQAYSIKSVPAYTCKQLRKKTLKMLYFRMLCRMLCIATQKWHELDFDRSSDYKCFNIHLHLYGYWYGPEFYWFCAVQIPQTNKSQSLRDPFHLKDHTRHTTLSWNWHLNRLVAKIYTVLLSHLYSKGLPGSTYYPVGILLNNFLLFTM